MPKRKDAKPEVEDVADEDAVAEDDGDTGVDAGVRGLVNVDVKLKGLVDIQFDRFLSMTKEDRPVEECMYLMKDGTLYLPAQNVMAFFCASQYASCVKLFVDTRKCKTVAQDMKALLAVSPAQIPILRNGKPVKFSKFDRDEEDKAADLYVHHDVERLKNGIPNPKARPTLRLPWEVKFRLGVFEMEGRSITVERVRRWLRDGGVLIGLGTHRPVFGKFEVAEFERLD